MISLTKIQINKAAKVFSRAFQEDPLYIRLFPNNDQRIHLLERFFIFRIQYGLLYGEVFATSQDLEGIVIWIPSKNVEMTQWKSFRADGMKLYKDLGKENLSKLQNLGNYTSTFHRRHANFPHIHLSPICVDPPLQGKGYASALLKPMFARLDQERLPCFLETQSEKNVSIYKKFGFKIVEQGKIPGIDIDHWAMLRKNP